MPRGSKIGERRGGRQRGAPNRRTVLAERILAIASERPTTSACQLVDILAKDQELPADIRMVMAREFLSAGRSRSVGASAVRSSARKRQKAQSSGPRPEPPGNRRLATLDGLFSIAQDTTVATDQRRKAASEVAQHFLPKKPGIRTGIRRWWVNAPADEYGFAVTPQIAAEYRDSKFELHRLANSGSNSPAISRKAEKLRARVQAILHRLQCPCPSLYGMDQRVEDGNRLVYFLRLREAKITLTEKQEAKVAHRRARVDSFDQGPESAARQRLSILRDQARIFKNAFGPRLTWKEQVDLRFLRLLYPQHSPDRFNPDADLLHYPLRDEAVAADGNLYPLNSKLRPLPPDLKDEDFEEFVEVPRDVYYDPAVPGHWWVIPSKIEMIEYIARQSR
jgi:hypothetical protein